MPVKGLVTASPKVRASPSRAAATTGRARQQAIRLTFGLRQDAGCPPVSHRPEATICLTPGGRGAARAPRGRVVDPYGPTVARGAPFQGPGGPSMATEPAVGAVGPSSPCPDYLLPPRVEAAVTVEAVAPPKRVSLGRPLLRGVAPCTRGSGVIDRAAASPAFWTATAITGSTTTETPDLQHRR